MGILRRHPLTVWTLGLTLFFGLLFGYLIGHSGSFSGPMSFLSLMKGEKNGFNYAATLTLSTARVFFFLLIILASSAISSEIQSGLLKTLLARRMRRKEIIWGKSLALLVLSCAAMIIMILLGLVIGGVLFGLGDVAEKGYVIHSAASLALNAVLTVAMTVLSLFAVINFSLLISVFFNNTLVSVVVGLGFHMAGAILMEFEGIRTYVLTTHLFFPLARFQKIAQGFAFPPAAEVKTSAAVCAAYAAVSLGAALYIFPRKDLP